jgi:hypothetical protein
MLVETDSPGFPSNPPVHAVFGGPSMRVLTSTAVLLFAASSAFAQLDSFTLHSKYGASLDRETFTVRPGIEMVVDYGPSKQVCRIQLPSGMQIVGTIPLRAITKQQVDEVLAEVVPASMRGKEVNRMLMAFGLPMLSVTEYEHVTISESKNGDIGNGITVTIKDPSCPPQKAPWNSVSWIKSAVRTGINFLKRTETLRGGE